MYHVVFQNHSQFRLRHYDYLTTVNTCYNGPMLYRPVPAWAVMLASKIEVSCHFTRKGRDMGRLTCVQNRSSDLSKPSPSKSQIVWWSRKLEKVSLIQLAAVGISLPPGHHRTLSLWHGEDVVPTSHKSHFCRPKRCIPWRAISAGIDSTTFNSEDILYVNMIK